MATATEGHIAPMRRHNSLPELGTSNRTNYDPGSSDRPTNLPGDVSIMSAPEASGTAITRVNTHVTFDTRQLSAAASNNSLKSIVSANRYIPRSARVVYRDATSALTKQFSEEQRHWTQDEDAVESASERAYEAERSRSGHQAQENRRKTPPTSEASSTEESATQQNDGFMWNTKAVNAAKLEIFTTFTRRGNDKAPKTATLNIAATQRLVLAYQQRRIASVAAELYLHPDGEDPDDIVRRLKKRIHGYCKSTFCSWSKALLTP